MILIQNHFGIIRNQNMKHIMKSVPIEFRFGYLVDPEKGMMIIRAKGDENEYWYNLDRKMCIEWTTLIANAYRYKEEIELEIDNETKEILNVKRFDKREIDWIYKEIKKRDV